MPKTSTVSGIKNAKDYSVHLPNTVLTKAQEEQRLKKLKELLAKAQTTPAKKK